MNKMKDMKYLLSVILIMCCSLLATAQISSIDVFTFFAELHMDVAAKRLTGDMGYKQGKWGYGDFFYKNTNIRMTVNNGKKVPNLSEPKSDAALVMLYKKSGTDYVGAIAQVFKSKTIADKLVSDLKKNGYKSTHSSSNASFKSWSYCHPESKKKFILKYFISTKEYVLLYSKYDYPFK